MGYFPNGTAGAIFHEQHCSKCEHDRNEDCPIWNAHLMYNYAECNNPDSILHMLIPKEADSCKMFIPRMGDLPMLRQKSE
jgi:hypothetical protein